MPDWQSYDGIADRYARLWAPRFERAAAHLLALAAPPPSGRFLDVGTGTGALPAVLGERVDDLAEVVGCDLSAPMLSRARRRVSRLQVAVAGATRLPFPEASFDMVTASFVLSHVRDYPRALGEALRVLKPAGVFAASDWAPAPADGCEMTWRDLLAVAIGEEAVRRAFEQAVPSDFSDIERLRRALVEGGFAEVRVRAVEVAFGEAATDFVAGRQLTAAGRFARHALGADRWNAFQAEVLEQLRARFGEHLSYPRSVVLAAGIKPGRPSRWCDA